MIAVARLLFPGLLALLAALLAAGPARAGVVTSLADDGSPGTLRAQIATTPAGGAVTFASGLTGTITLRSGALVIGQDLTIVGPGSGALAVDGGHTASAAGSRVLAVTAGTVALSGLTIQNGQAPSGEGAPYYGNGAGINNAGALTLTGCALLGNTASAGGGGVYNTGPSLSLAGCTFQNNAAPFGGGVEDNGNGAALTATGCTFQGNTNTNDGGGGVFIGGINGTATLSGCTLSGNGGGGVYLSGNALTLTDCTLSGNHATSGGGAINSGGALTLVNCTLSGNAATFGGGGLAVNGGTTTLTACSLSGNTGSDGGGFAANGGTVTLTDDVLYGDGGGEIAINGTAVTAAYCDVAGGYSGSGNIDADPLFVNAAGGDLHLRPGSPCLGAGTADGAPTADKDGRMRPNPPSIGAYEGPPPPPSAHLLWANPDGKAAFWDVRADGTFTVAGVYGPYADGQSLWHATALATGPDRVSHIVWNNPDGHAALWNVQTDGSVSAVSGFGPYADGASLWRAAGVSVGPDNLIHLLWTNPDGKAAFWNVTQGGAASVLAGYGPYTDGSALWAAAGVSTGPDGVSHLLWTNPDGKAAFWSVSDADGSVSGVTGYGPYLDGSALWGAVGVSTGPDGASHLLWSNPDGKAAFWSLGRSGSVGSVTGYGPYTDGTGGLWSVTALATGPDNVSRLLWDNPDGKAALWSLDGSGAPATVTGYGPYTDGSANNLWSAVGVSAGP